MVYMGSQIVQSSSHIVDAKVESMTANSSKPKYELISHELAREISSMKPGQILPTEATIAKRFGVSRVTVRQSMDLLENHNLIVRHQGKGSFVKDNALKKQDIRQIGLVFMDLPFNQDVYTLTEISEVESYLSKLRISLAYGTCKTEDLIVGRYSPILENKLCQGILLDGFVQDFHFKLAEKFGIPILALGTHNISPLLPQIRINTDHLLLNMCSSLIENYGHPVAFVCDPLKYAYARELFHAYQKAIRKLHQKQELIVFNDTEALGEEIMADLINRSGSQKFSVITAGCYVADLIKEYEKLGLSIDDYPILGYGIARRVAPEYMSKISVVDFDLNTTVSRGVDLLIEMIQTGRTDVYELLEFEVKLPDELKK
jgi:DNA-binding LacI/PurR family transcriptional regulator